MTGCVLCGNPLKRTISLGWVFSFQQVKGSIICLSCADGFEEIVTNNACPGCFQKQENRERCASCVRWEEKYPKRNLQHRALYTYNASAEALMDRIKKQGDVVVAEVFQKIVYERLKKYQKTHRIVWIQNSQDAMPFFLKAANISYEVIEFSQVKKLEPGEQPLLLVGDVYTTGEDFIQIQEQFGCEGTVKSFSLFR